MNAPHFRVAIPDRDYWGDQISCQTACPVGTDARGYVQAIAAGDYERAYLIARGPNPLASLCARICGAPCEASCRRGRIDAPVAIRSLKRFAAEQYAALNDGGTPAELLNRLMDGGADHTCQGEEDIASFVHWLRESESSDALRPPAPDGERVAVIGSGPAGLSAAHDMALMGFRVTVFELEDSPAGMLYTGVPAYRLPRDVITAEIEVIRSLGVEFRCNVEVGKDVSFRTLQEEYAAVLIAVGLKRSRVIPIPGVDAKGVYGAVEFLREMALRHTLDLGRHVVVIGGGNVAYDAARTVVRQSGFDASRSALRQPGVSQVTLCSLESLEEMPADDVEILEGDEEGVTRLNRVGPKEVLLDEAGRVRGVRMVRVLSVFNSEGRFDPQFDEESITEIAADSVILAVGQQADLTFLDPSEDGIQRGKRGNLVLDDATQSTTVAGVFAAGEIARGPGLMIHAVANGKKAAREIYRHLRGRTIRREEVDLHFELGRYRREMGYENLPRTPVPVRPASERLASTTVEVERGYDEAAARVEARRCLDCGVNTIFDSELCILCGGCADVCPESCLRLVSVPRIETTRDLEHLLDARTGEGPRGLASAIIKDEERCIRCGLCAERCPVGAITMERYTFGRSWTEQPPAARPADVEVTS